MKTEHWQTVRRNVLSYKWDQRYVAALHFKRYQRLRKEKGLQSLEPFDRNNCIFIHIPKNGGISIANSLFGENRMLDGHYSVDFYKVLFSSEYERYFKFAISRNPWDRVVSAFHFLKRGGLHIGDARWAEKHLSQFNTFDEFVMKWLDRKNIYKGIHFIPQHEFICDSKGKIAVDYVGRFESIGESFEIIRKKLNLPEKKLSHSNRSIRQVDFRSYYNDQTAARVGEIYAKDINLFNYKKN